MATLLVQNGTLQQGDIIIAGTAVGRVRAMIDDKGQKLDVRRSLRPCGDHRPVRGARRGRRASTPWPTSSMARELVEQRKDEDKAPQANARVSKVSLEDLFSQIQAGEMKNLNIIVKADVQGSAEAVKASLEKLSNDEVRVRVIHGARGRHQRVRRDAGLHLQRHHRGLQRPPRHRRPGVRRPRQCGYADVPRHLRRHQRD